MLRELEVRYGQRVQFRYWNYYGSDMRPLLERYGVRYHPTTVFVRADGTVAERVQGILRPSTYVNALEALG